MDIKIGETIPIPKQFLHLTLSSYTKEDQHAFYLQYKNLNNRIVKIIIGDYFQFTKDKSIWFKISDFNFNKQINYEVYV